jgi:hypothetical protein
VGRGGGQPAGPTLQPLVGLLHGHALQEAVTRNLVCYRLNQVGNSSLDPYKYLPADGIQDTTLYL